MAYRSVCTIVCLACAALLGSAAKVAAEVPSWLPRYDVDVQIEPHQHYVFVKERVRWTNAHQTPTDTIVFNAHAAYSIPDKDIGFLAKSLEILRMAPKDALDFNGSALQIKSVQLAPQAGQSPPPAVKFAFQEKINTALEVKLPFAVPPGQSVVLDLDFSLRLPQKQGRWGQWKGVTFLAQWLPVVAYYDDKGWQPAPFIPWHQPFYNEAGLYQVRVVLPTGHKLGASSAIAAVHDRGDGWQQIDLEPAALREFALFASPDYLEFTGQAGETAIRVLALPGHEWYAQEMVKIASEALPHYGVWFGKYPYPQFTVVDTFFGWNGNECGGLVMIDDRIFGLPHLARNFVDSLLTHEICHQWWYNLVGTNGYAETWMDEGLAVHFSHKTIDRKLGKNNTLLTWPEGFGWLPNIHRDDYRYFGLLGCIGRGEMGPVVQPMPEFGHLVNLMSMTYDRGGKVVGMIEERMGEAAFLDFMRHIRCKYEYRILHVADYQHELEAYTGQSWEEFFQNWLYKNRNCDWCIEHVDFKDRCTGRGVQDAVNEFFGNMPGVRPAHAAQPVHAHIVLKQKGECNEPTVLGFRFDHGDGYQLRIPILPGKDTLELEECSAKVNCAGDGCIVVDIELPQRPTQIAVDPDRVLLDSNPLNNLWRPEINFRVAPVYTQIEETDITNAYDRWNFIVGPWIYGASYNDPWYTRSEMIGLRAGVYRTQEFSAGGYLAYRTEDRNVVAGADFMWDHFPIPHMQLGFNFERSIGEIGNNGYDTSRAVLYSRYVFMYGDSLYLPPFNYLEGFAAIQNHALPQPDAPPPGADPFSNQSTLGMHYHINYLTPYWDPEGGFALDLVGQEGVPVFGEHRWSEQFSGQFSFVKSMPDWMNGLREVPGLGWLCDSRVAMRLHGAAALPNNGLFFELGGGDLFRGFDANTRQGSMDWVASAEWRFPLWLDIEKPLCDDIVTAKNLYGAVFYDVGNSYINGHETGPIAHAFGVGLHLDVSWFGLIERTTLRLDLAKAINGNSPGEIWVGIQYPF